MKILRKLQRKWYSYRLKSLARELDRINGSIESCNKVLAYIRNNPSRDRMRMYEIKELEVIIYLECEKDKCIKKMNKITGALNEH